MGRPGGEAGWWDAFIDEGRVARFSDPTRYPVGSRWVGPKHREPTRDTVNIVTRFRFVKSEVGVR